MPQRNKLIRPLVDRLHPYIPGEQPKVKGLVKLNTNENPYPPAPAVLKAVRQATDGRLRLYPNPTSQPLREKLARLHGCGPENIVMGNGSDELLALAVRAFVEPLSSTGKPRVQPQSTVQYFAPCYSLYPVLAEIHGAAVNPVPLNSDFSLPQKRGLSRGGLWKPNAALTFVTTPNAPAGRGYEKAELARLCRAHQGVVVLDEAYVDFAGQDALSLALEHPHVLVARTFSKAYSLCFQRVGYFVGHPQLIGAIDKIRDSYNVNGLGQVAALATLDALPYYRANFKKVIATRDRLGRELTALGFRVFPSATNFLMATPPIQAAPWWMQELRSRKVLVRWFDSEPIRNSLRITVGTDREADSLLKAARQILHTLG
jgi:histidinol-phosphate aminotransferase